MNKGVGRGARFLSDSASTACARGGGGWFNGRGDGEEKGGMGGFSAGDNLPGRCLRSFQAHRPLWPQKVQNRTPTQTIRIAPWLRSFPCRGVRHFCSAAVICIQVS